MKKIILVPIGISFLLTGIVYPQLLDPKGGDVETKEVTEEEFTKLRLQMAVLVKKIDKKDLVVEDVIKLIEHEMKVVGYPIKVRMRKSLREKKLFLKVERISVYTALSIIRDNLNDGDFKISGKSVIFPDWLE